MSRKGNRKTKSVDRKYRVEYRIQYDHLTIILTEIHLTFFTMTNEKKNAEKQSYKDTFCVLSLILLQNSRIKLAGMVTGVNIRDT